MLTGKSIGAHTYHISSILWHQAHTQTDGEALGSAKDAVQLYAAATLFQCQFRPFI